MSINEVNEFEAINQKTGERKFMAETECKCKEAIGQVKKKKTCKRAVGLVIVTMLALAISMVGITALEQIGWINGTFRVVLMCMAGSVAMFKTGYLWHEIKH